MKNWGHSKKSDNPDLVNRGYLIFLCLNIGDPPRGRTENLLIKSPVAVNLVPRYRDQLAINLGVAGMTEYARLNKGVPKPSPFRAPILHFLELHRAGLPFWSALFCQ